MWPGVKIRKVSLCSEACNLYFYPQLLELIAKSQLTSLSGIAQKNYMNILEKVVQKGKKQEQGGGGGGGSDLLSSVNHILENSQAIHDGWRRAPLLISVVQLHFPSGKDWRGGRVGNGCIPVGIWGDSSFSLLPPLLASYWVLFLTAEEMGCSCPQPICSLCCRLVASLLYQVLPLLQREGKLQSCLHLWGGLNGWHVALPSLML